MGAGVTRESDSRNPALWPSRFFFVTAAWHVAVDIHTTNAPTETTTTATTRRGHFGSRFRPHKSRSVQVFVKHGFGRVRRASTTSVCCTIARGRVHRATTSSVSGDAHVGALLRAYYSSVICCTSAPRGVHRVTSRLRRTCSCCALHRASSSSQFRICSSRGPHRASTSSARGPAPGDSAGLLMPFHESRSTSLSLARHV